MKKRLAIYCMACILLFVFASGHPSGSGPMGVIQAQVVPPTGVGPIPVTGLGNTATAAAAGPGVIVMAAPANAATTQVRNYVYQVNCVNSSASTVTVGTIWDSGTTGQVATVVELATISCPAASANSPLVNFQPPLRLRPGSALGMSTTVSAATAYFFASGFTAK